MHKFTIYHNPKCSNSRKALEILHSHNINPTIIEYLKTSLNLEQIIQLRSHFNLKDFIRHNEPVFNELKLTLKDEDSLLAAMVLKPILMQRPIVTYADKAVIARPPDRVLELIDYAKK